MEISLPNLEKLEINYKKVLSRLGFLSGKTRLDYDTEKSIRESLEFSRKLISPKYVTAYSDIVLKPPKESNLEPRLTIISMDIYKLFTGCAKAFGFAVTIGSAIEKKRDDYIEQKQPTNALILDSIGSVAAEEITELINQELKKIAEKDGMVLTRRFSPGYGDWGLTSQPDFLNWLGAEKIGIKLSPGFQMIPEKSVSGIIGIKPK